MRVSDIFLLLTLFILGIHYLVEKYCSNHPPGSTRKHEDEEEDDDEGDVFNKPPVVPDPEPVLAEY